MQLSLSRRNTLEKNWEDDITDLEKRLNAARDKLNNRKLISHTEILARFVAKPEKTLDDKEEN